MSAEQHNTDTILPAAASAPITQLNHENDRPYDVIMWFNGGLEIEYEDALRAFAGGKKVYIIGNGITELRTHDLQLPKEVVSKITSETQLIFSSHGSDELPNDCSYNFADNVTLTSKAMVARLLSPISDAQKSGQISLDYGVSLHISSCLAGTAIHNDDIKFIPEISDILPLSTCFIHAGETIVIAKRGIKVFNLVKNHDFSDGVNSRFKLLQKLYLEETVGDGTFIQLPPKTPQFKKEIVALKMTPPEILDADNILKQWDEYAVILEEFATKYSIAIENLKGVTIDIAKYLDRLIEFSAIQDCSIAKKLLVKFQLLKTKGLISEDDYNKYLNKFIAKIDLGSLWTSELLKLFEELQGEEFVANKVLNVSSIINIAHKLPDKMSDKEKGQCFKDVIEKYKIQEITMKDLIHWHKQYISNSDILIQHCGIKKGSALEVIEYLSKAHSVIHNYWEVLKIHLPTCWSSPTQSDYSNTTTSLYEKYKHFMECTQGEMPLSLQDLKIAQEKFSPDEFGEMLQTMQTTFSITEVMEIFGNIDSDIFGALIAKIIPHIDWSQLDLDTVVKALHPSDKYLAAQNWTYLLKHFPEKFVNITGDKTFSINEVTEIIDNLWCTEVLINILGPKIERNNIDIDQIIRHVNAQSEPYIKCNVLKNSLYLLDQFTDGGIAHTLRILSECNLDNELPRGIIQALLKSSISEADLEQIMTSYNYTNDMFNIMCHTHPTQLESIISTIMSNPNNANLNLYLSLHRLGTNDTDPFIEKFQILLLHYRAPTFADMRNYIGLDSDLWTRIVETIKEAGIKEIPVDASIFNRYIYSQEKITKISNIFKIFQDNNIVLKIDNQIELESSMRDEYTEATNPDMNLYAIKEVLFQHLTFPSPEEEAIGAFINTALELVLGTCMYDVVEAIELANTFDQE